MATYRTITINIETSVGNKLWLFLDSLKEKHPEIQDDDMVSAKSIREILSRCNTDMREIDMSNTDGRNTRRIQAISEIDVIVNPQYHIKRNVR